MSEVRLQRFYFLILRAYLFQNVLLFVFIGNSVSTDCNNVMSTHSQNGKNMNILLLSNFDNNNCYKWKINTARNINTICCIGLLFFIPPSFLIWKNLNHSLLYSVWMVKDSHYRWTAAPCKRDQPGVSFCQRSHAARCDEGWTLAWQRGGTPVVSILIVQHCATPCGATECSWFWDGSGWTVADMLRHSCVSEAMPLQLDTSGKLVAGRRTKGLTHSLPAPVLLFALSDGSFPPDFPRLSLFIVVHSHSEIKTQLRPSR